MDHIFLRFTESRTQGEIPSQLGFHPSHQLFRIERFAHIVVRPHGKSQDLITVLCFCRQYYNRYILTFPYLHHRGQAIETRHHHINDQQMDRVARQHIQCFQTIIGLKGFITFQLQQFADCPDDLPVVIYHQYTLFIHHRTPFLFSQLFYQRSLT